MPASETPQNSNDTSQNFLTEKSRLLMASISLVLLLVLLPVFQFINFNGHFHYQYGVDQTLFILIYLSFALVPIICLFFLINFFMRQNREILVIRIILALSLFLFMSQLYSTTLTEMSLTLRSCILFTIFVLGKIAIQKSPKTLVWGLAWLLVIIAPATLYHGYQQYSYLSKPARDFKQKPIIPKNDRHNIYLIFLDGSTITSSYLDEDKLPKKEFLPNFRKFLVDDANWFPNSVSNSPQTFLSYPTLISGKLFSSRTNKYLADEPNIFSILNLNYKINSFIYKHSETSFCRTNPKLCNLSSILVYIMPLKILLENFIDVSTFTLYPLDLHLFDLFNHSYNRSTSVNHFMQKIETDSNKGNFYIIQLFDREETEILDFDKFMGDFLNVLNKTGKYPDSIIIIMSDHGFNRESSNRYGLKAKHTWSLYKVPFAIKTPGTGKGKNYGYKAQSIDVAPTLLAQVLTAKELEKLQFDGVDVLLKRPIRNHYINLDQTDAMYQLVDKGGDDPELIKTPLNQIIFLKQ